eukprot:g8654.t1
MFANASANESEEPEYASLAELEDVGAIFKNSKVYQDYVAKERKSNYNKRANRRRANTVTINPRLIDAISNHFFTNQNTGGVVSIAYKDNPKFCKGYGFANKAKEEAMTCDHLFQIASISKGMSSLLSLVAAKKKAIDLDEPVRINYPKFNPTSHSSGSNAASTLTVRDLLNHRTGMPRHDYLWQSPFSPRSGKITKDQIIESVQFLEMSRPQRVIPEYNNVMYTVAGEATTKGLNMLNVETGKPDKLWEDYMETELFQPFGMTQGTYPTLGRVPKSDMDKFATRYNKDITTTDPDTGKL